MGAHASGLRAWVSDLTPRQMAHCRAGGLLVVPCPVPPGSGLPPLRLAVPHGEYFAAELPPDSLEWWARLLSIPALRKNRAVFAASTFYVRSRFLWRT